ncbi:Short chain dehydrogenase/reductase family oxidoreductase [Pseudomonas savastanoi pv. glycinea]|nr:Short chain dehydrogenase/reductase family oxidoreductase [Pseudomonas savastanoi pv. glycinea]
MQVNVDNLMSPEEVALYTVRALAKDRAVIIPGFSPRLWTLSPRLVSRWLARQISGYINRKYCPR